MLKKLVLIFFTFLNLVNFANDSQDIKKISESEGHILGKNLKDLDIKLDIEQLIKGTKKSC